LRMLLEGHDDHAALKDSHWQSPNSQYLGQKVVFARSLQQVCRSSWYRKSHVGPASQRCHLQKKKMIC
jgi:hypothetical protein